SPALRAAVADDVRRYPTLAEHALGYLSRFDVSRSEAQQLLDVVKKAPLSPDVDVRLARFFADAIFSERMSEDIANIAILRITRESVDHGLGYAKGVWLLALHKHGKRDHRDTIARWATLERLADDSSDYILCTHISVSKSSLVSSSALCVTSERRT